MMTFEQFRDTARFCEDLSTVIPDARWDDEPVPAKGNVYVDALYIERMQPHWPAATLAKGAWYLLIGNQEYVSDDLESLERHLYEFACDEGYCDE